jgi:hypothetical protein
MKQMVTFEPFISKVGDIKPTHTIGEIDKEVGIYSATPERVYKDGGPIARSFIEEIPNEFFTRAKKLNLHIICDIRIHRLNVGEWASVPGWHCDGDVRKSYGAQPELERPQGAHIICCVSSHPEGVSNFEFVTEPVTCELDTEHPTMGVYAQLHNYVEANDIQRIPSHDGMLYWMNSETIHRPRQAKVRGWRMFMRASMYHQGCLEGDGKFSKQEQVYILSEANGW